MPLTSTPGSVITLGNDSSAHIHVTELTFVSIAELIQRALQSALQDLSLWNCTRKTDASMVEEPSAVSCLTNEVSEWSYLGAADDGHDAQRDQRREQAVDDRRHAGLDLRVLGRRVVELQVAVRQAEREEARLQRHEGQVLVKHLLVGEERVT